MNFHKPHQSDDCIEPCNALYMWFQKTSHSPSPLPSFLLYGVCGPLTPLRKQHRQFLVQPGKLSPFECRWSRATHAVHGTTFESDGLCHVRNATFIRPLDLSSVLQILAPLGQRGEFQNDNALGVPPKIDRGTYTPKPPKASNSDRIGSCTLRTHPALRATFPRWTACVGQFSVRGSWGSWETKACSNVGYELLSVGRGL